MQTICHITLARTLIQHADLFPHCRDHFVRNETHYLARRVPLLSRRYPATDNVSNHPFGLKIVLNLQMTYIIIAHTYEQWGRWGSHMYHTQSKHAKQCRSVRRTRILPTTELNNLPLLIGQRTTGVVLLHHVCIYKSWPIHYKKGPSNFSDMGPWAHTLLFPGNTLYYHIRLYDDKASGLWQSITKY